MSKPDLILYNGRIYPDAKSRSRFEALAVWKGRVTDIGSSQEILKLRARATTTINLRGKTVLPGFCDSHIHLLSYGMLLRTLDLSKTRSIEEMNRQVAKRASLMKPDEWILGRGWDDEKLREHRYPEKHDLDHSTSNPVFLKRVCGHVAVANSKALSLSGIDSDTPEPEGGVVLRDSRGAPNGVLKERALELVELAVPQSMKEIKKSLVLAARRLARLGLTSLHCIVNDANELKALQELKREREIPQSIYAIVPVKLLDQLVSLGLSTQRGEEAFRIGGVKLYLDGSLGARTAALTSPYNDNPVSNGMLTMSREELKRVAMTSSEGGFQLCIHAIGDRAVELAIQIIEEVFGPLKCRKFRHRIEHASLVSGKSILKMGKLGIIASVQPRFIYSDSWAEERLGASRMHSLYPFASMTQEGILLTAGSDCPVEDPNPFEGVWSATARPGLEGKERLTVSQALAAYTISASFASFCEESRGTLVPRNIADIVVLDRDPFECSPEALRQTRVIKTIIAGSVFA